MLCGMRVKETGNEKKNCRKREIIAKNEDKRKNIS